MTQIPTPPPPNWLLPVWDCHKGDRSASLNNRHSCQHCVGHEQHSLQQPSGPETLARHPEPILFGPRHCAHALTASIPRPTRSAPYYERDEQPPNTLLANSHATWRPPVEET